MVIFLEESRTLFTMLKLLGISTPNLSAYSLHQLMSLFNKIFKIVLDLKLNAEKNGQEAFYPLPG